MKNYFLVLFLLASTTSLFQSGSNCDDGVLVEKEGIVIVEAESTTLSEGWELQDEVAGFSGEGYLTWMLPTNVEAQNQGLLSYSFKISEPGKYTVKIRNYHDCEDFTECNDIFLKMNDGSWEKNFNHTLSEWDWNSRQDIDHVFSDATYDLEAGTHTLHLSGRSQHFSIDKIAIFREGTPEKVYQTAEASTCEKVSE
ncbi:MAG: hypothetical protein CL670_06170 [Balneola sp.]|jgi:hypothetical protein|nr:hypothetical protein [Balneola sp.]MBE78722.1 hypothetical protein [Balneola sp.]HBX67559.1 hypothetical protein [Balneolaceae bacterium]|tara:strand:+ start:9551 stop:10141 length:591 start_codon:yes stop_codon:yes gene_type:complete